MQSHTLYQHKFLRALKNDPHCNYVAREINSIL